MEQVIEAMVAVLGEKHRRHVEAAVEDDGVEPVAQAIEEGYRAGRDLAELFGGEA